MLLQTRIKLLSSLQPVRIMIQTLLTCWRCHRLHSIFLVAVAWSVCSICMVALPFYSGNPVFAKCITIHIPAQETSFHQFLILLNTERFIWHNQLLSVVHDKRIPYGSAYKVNHVSPCFIRSVILPTRETDLSRSRVSCVHRLKSCEGELAEIVTCKATPLSQH